jgi:L-2,4-diaminobutyrate transaminase
MQIPRPSAAEADRRHVFHPFSSPRGHERGGSRIMVRGSGSRLWDEDGRSYLDAMAGLWCVNVGYGRNEIAEAVREQASTLAYYHSFGSMATSPPALLAERVLEHAPQQMSKVFFGNSGSDANDTQVKLVWLYNNTLGRPQKKKIIARDRSYHGVTVVAASLSGLPSMHAGFDLPLDFVRHTTAPYRLWEAEAEMSDEAFVAKLATDLEQLILEEGPETVAAFIADPIQAAGGVIVPPVGYFEAIQAVLDRYDVLLIADEVVTGFGRLGSWFGSEPLEIEPDLMTLAKGITSGYAPLSACLVSERIWETLADGVGEEILSHGYTYSSHPLTAAAALANLDILEDEDLITGAVGLGEHLSRRLHEAFDGHPHVLEIRGQGLIAAVELGRADLHESFERSLKVGARVSAAALERGVITRALPESDTIAFSPPLVIGKAEIDEAVEAAREALDEVGDGLGQSGG